MTHTVRLPKGWAETSLGDVTVGKVQQGPPDSEVPYIDISSIDRETKAIGDLRKVDSETAPTRARQWVETHDVLVSMTRPNLNAVAMVPESLSGAVASTGFDILRAMGVLPSWIFNRVRSREFVSAVCENLQGVVYPAIRPRDVRTHKLPIPPLPEQHRIVEAIESYLTRLDDAVASLERVQRNLERYRASVLKAAVEGRLVPTEAELAKQENRSYEPASELLERILFERKTRWIEDAAEKARAKGNADALLEAKKKAEKKYKEPSLPDATDLPTLPEGWCWATVEQLASDKPRSIQSGPFGSSLLHSEFQEAGKLVIGIDNVQDGFFAMGSNHRITERKFEELARFEARPEDVLVTVMGTIGRCCVVPQDIEPAIITKHVYRVSPDHGLVCSEFLLMCLRATSSVRKQMFGQVRGQTRPGLNGAIIKALAIPLPRPNEQTRIVNEVESLLSRQGPLDGAIERGRSRSMRLRQSILKWAFEGKLVEQDPDDEPASALLERIKAQRSGARR